MDGPVVEFRHVSHAYGGSSALALNGVDLVVRRGERLAILGPSGAGKSTLLRCINGLVAPTDGEVWALGACVSSMPEHARVEVRRKIGMVFQEFALIDRLTVLTNVLVGRLGYTSVWAGVFGRFSASDVDAAKQAIAEVGLEGLEQRQVRHLSGGQRQRVGIARALVQGAALLLGDEPTANLDVRTADEVLQLLLDVADKHSQALILNLHDVRAARRRCSRIVGMRAGSIVWDGPADAFDDTQLDRLFAA